MDLSAFQLFKNNARTNITDRLHDTPLIVYARVIEVIDIQTVTAKAVVQAAFSPEVYTVSLLSLSSSAAEINAYPKIGDGVLLLFLQRRDPAMFIKDFIKNPDATGYNAFSGVGILMSTVKRKAQTIIDFYEDGGTPVAEINSRAELYAAFTDLAALTFCRAAMDGGDERLISMFFGQGRPFAQTFLSRAVYEHGFWKDGEGNLIKLDAPVTERYSVYAPITKDIQGKQNISIGLGRDKDDNPAETEAPVNITFGEKADVTVTSKSGKTEEYAKDVTLKGDGNVTFEAGAKVTVKNAAESLGAILSDLIQTVNDAVTLGGPTTQAMNPATQTALQALKTRCEALMGK